MKYPAFLIWFEQRKNATHIGEDILKELYNSIWQEGYKAAVHDEFKIREQRTERSESWPHQLGRGVE